MTANQSKGSKDNWEKSGTVSQFVCYDTGSYPSMITGRLAHYEITGHLGSGGMGEVYHAMDSKLARSVAIKVLPEAFARDPERLARFEREARVLRRLPYHDPPELDAARA